MRELVRGEAASWRRLQQTREWCALRAACGGDMPIVRALEVTLGRNGAHPHFHALLFVRKGAALDGALGAVCAAWPGVVRRVLGEARVPNARNGTTLTPCHDGKYISKLGLEVSFAPGKRGKGRTVWQLMADLAADARPSDVALFGCYCDATKGLHQLQWSRGLKRRVVGVSPIAEGDGQAAGMATVARIPKETWREFAAVSGAKGRLLRLANAQGPSRRARIAALMCEVLSVDPATVEWRERELHWCVRLN